MHSDILSIMPCLPIPSLHPRFTFSAVYCSDWDGHRPFAEAAFNLPGQPATAASMQAMLVFQSIHDFVNSRSKKHTEASRKGESIKWFDMGLFLTRWGCAAISNTHEAGRRLPKLEATQIRDLLRVEWRVAQSVASCALPCTLTRPPTSACSARVSMAGACKRVTHRMLAACGHLFDAIIP